MTENWRQEAGERHDKKVDEFLDTHPDVKLKSINIGGQTVMMFEQSDLDLTDFALIGGILAKQTPVEKDGIFNNCYFIATDSVDDGSSDGVFFASNDASKVIGYADHAVNYKQLTDGTILVVDYTAPSNQDWGRGIFKTFCMHVKTKNDAFKMLSEFHGGEWRQKTEEELAETRKYDYRKKK